MAKKSFDIQINTAWCKGCEVCVAICPKKVLEMSDKPAPSGYFTAVVKRQADCIGCMECELHCPDLAIEVKSKKEEVKSDAKGG
ncbi:MAG: 4Fe-4S binding protein [Planctomycetes bacterium]|nr:4Fe-4S binding protein [Planctomycetota bacterium]